MKKILPSLFLFLCIFTCKNLSAADLVKCYDIHPNCYQEIIAISTFEGDRHGHFTGDPLVVLGDGSSWKIHPKDHELFAAWEAGDVVRIGYRTSKYWFKREHKYFMYNHTKQEEARVMLITHQTYPNELRITSKRFISGVNDLTNFLVDYNISIWPTRNGIAFSWKGDYHYFNYSHIFCVVTLSDGSAWFLINRHNDLKLTSKVYVAAQKPSRIYDQGEKFYINNPRFDFFFINGTQREAWTCRAYPLFPR